MTPTDPDDSARATRLNDLRTRFLSTLDARVGLILAHARAVRVGAWPGPDSQVLLNEVHGLAGAGRLTRSDPVIVREPKVRGIRRVIDASIGRPTIPVLLHARVHALHFPWEDCSAAQRERSTTLHAPNACGLVSGRPVLADKMRP